MPKRTVASALALLLFLAAGLPAQSRTFPVDELRAGMVGIGKTVFEGDRLDEFKVHILGVLRNVIGTRRNLILARLEGGPLANTGVIAGMSGSPVYIDGRLRRRRVLLARSVLEGADRGHHADRRNDRGGDVCRSAPPGRARRAADAADPGEPEGLASAGVQLDASVRREPCGRPGVRRRWVERRASGRCSGRLPRR